MSKLITISYRLPYRLSVLKSRLITSPSAGGLSTALRSYFDGENSKIFDSVHWIGCADISQRAYSKVMEAETFEKDNLNIHPVFLSGKSKELFYDGFCNSVLWPLFLYFPSFVVYRNDFFEEYVSANLLMKEKVLQAYSPGDTIWVHDYHWMLLPALLRQDIPDARIGFFLHIPFPSFELFRLLPKTWRTKVLIGLLGSDVIGFQTDQFSEHFMECVSRLMPEFRMEDGMFLVHERPSLVKTLPISIDYEKFRNAARSREVKNIARRIKRRLHTERLILSVDRLDYTKAILNRLEGFELFLGQNPEWREKVSYLLLMVPTRESILKYKENKMNVEALVSRINGKYGNIGWTPVVYQYQTVEFSKLVALYASADIALVVPSRDGMNLVAKEYVASRAVPDGVLILSETAGAANELEHAILVNSNDRQEIADSILEGLLMPAHEQAQRMGSMQQRIRDFDISGWATEFMTSISDVIDNFSRVYE